MGVASQVEAHPLIHQVSYSLHSCFHELEKYVQLVRPKYVAGKRSETRQGLGLGRGRSRRRGSMSQLQGQQMCTHSPLCLGVSRVLPWGEAVGVFHCARERGWQEFLSEMDT